MIPYGNQWITDEDVEAVVDVMRNAWLTQGPIGDQFERAIADYVGAKYCVTFANATAGLHCAVKVLDLPEGCEGITTPNTFLASSNCMVYNGVKPVFADISPTTYNLTEETIAERITEKTKLLIPVHFAGQPCPMEAIGALAQKHGLKIIEDAAHAIGSIYEDGSRVGCCKNSVMTVFSFHPVKTVTSGEGGAVTTNDPEIYKRLIRLRSHGVTKDPEQLEHTSPGPWYYEMLELGFNYRLTEMQAALGLSQIKRLDMFKARRREIIAQYNAAFAGMQLLKTPFEGEGLCSCFHLYIVRIDFKTLGMSRKEVMAALMERGVGSQVLYIPVYTQPWYEKTYGVQRGLCPEAEAYYEETLALPLFPRMNDADVQTVITAVKEILH